MSCKDPKEIKGSSNVFFNKRGFSIVSWLVESEKKQDPKLKAKERFEKNKDEDEDDDLVEVIQYQHGQFSQCVSLKLKNSGFMWSLIYMGL